MPAATHTLVIGYGSPIRGDDAIGPLGAEALAASALPAGVEVLARHVLTADLVPDLAAARRVIFLDACVGGHPGQVNVQALAPQPGLASTMAHVHDPRELLAWCVALYGRAPQAWLVSAEGASFDYAHCQLSACAQAALADMLGTVRAMLDEPDEGSQLPAGARVSAPCAGSV